MLLFCLARRGEGERDREGREGEESRGGMGGRLVRGGGDDGGGGGRKLTASLSKW